MSVYVSQCFSMCLLFCREITIRATEYVYESIPKLKFVHIFRFFKNLLWCCFLNFPVMGRHTHREHGQIEGFVQIVAILIPESVDTLLNDAKTLTR